MKIAITADPFIPVPPELYGGIERIIDMLISELIKRGHEVTLFAHKNSNVDCKLIPYRTDRGGLRNHISNTWTINKYLSTNKVDILHSFGRLGYLLPQMPLTTPKLMSYQREPTVSQIKRATNLSKRGSIAFTGCSHYISSKIKPYAQAYTIYNGVDTSVYKDNIIVQDDAPLIFLGRIEDVKGTHTAIEIATNANRDLIIAGNVPAYAKNYFNKQVKPFLNDRITYVGPVDDKEKIKLLRQAAALLMPIHWDEPFGIVMIEATACGTPVIGFNRGAVPEVVKNGLNGFVVNNVHEAVSKIAELHTIDRKIVRKDTETRFAFDKIASDYLAIYKKLTEIR